MVAVPSPTATASQPTAEVISPDDTATLNSLRQVDNHPLYTMRYVGPYAGPPESFSPADDVTQDPLPASWGCALFAALGDPEHMLYGRNFDWMYSPALLLFTDPPNGHASVSMVDLAYLGFDEDQAQNLASLPMEARAPLLRAPDLPFDGMNEHGLVVGMAAVPTANLPPDPAKPTIGSLGMIRQLLDHARSIDEALAILESYNVSMAGGPAVHYLIADATGHAVLVEFYESGLTVLPNQEPWHAATNFLRAPVGESGRGQCWRYDAIEDSLSQREGQLSAPEALELLEHVSQEITQWSVVYGISDLQVWVAMGRQFDAVHVFELASAPQ